MDSMYLVGVPVMFWLEVKARNPTQASRRAEGEVLRVLSLLEPEQGSPDYCMTFEAKFVGIIKVYTSER